MRNMKSGDKLPDRGSHESSGHPTLLRLGRCGAMMATCGESGAECREIQTSILAEAEKTAIKILREKWDNQYSVNVDEIAEQMNIDIRYVNLPTGTAGLIIKSPHECRPIIFLDKDLTPQRRRFTIAHEIGHYVEHVSVNGIDSGVPLWYDDPKLQSEEIRAARRPTQNGEPDTTVSEIFADAFAHALLMPAWEVKTFSNLGMLPSEVAACFGVPVAVIGNRLIQLGVDLRLKSRI